MHKPLNASLFSVIDLKASHWFEPSQAHYPLSVRFKTENKQMALARSRETVRAPEMRKRMPELEYAPVAKPDDQ